MKITRLPRIRNYRIYKDFNWPADLYDFSRYNLIYGWNGAGKTSLSTLFQHLQSKEPPKDAEVYFQIDERLIKHSDFDSATLPQIRVFNRNTVDRSIFELPGKEFLPIYFLGENSVEKQKEIEGLKKNLTELEQKRIKRRMEHANLERDNETLCSAEAKSIKSMLTVAGGGPYNNYDSRAFKSTANTLATKSDVLGLSEAELTECLQTKDAKAKADITENFGVFSDVSKLTLSVTAILKRSLISETIDELTYNPSLASWIENGLAVHEEHGSYEYCKFCEQPLPQERLKLLNAHFNDEFKKFSIEIQTLIQETEGLIQGIRQIKLPPKELFYEHLWSKYGQCETQFKQYRSGIESYLQALNKALKTKQENPFEELTLQPFLSFLNGQDSGLFLKIIDALTTGSITIAAFQLSEAARDIDALIEQHNLHTKNFQQTVIAARKKLEFNSVVLVFPKYIKLQKDIQDAEEQSAAFEKEINDCESKISKIERDIRKHQLPAEELNKEIASYLGRSELRFEVKETGYQVFRNNALATHLSEGERTAIAFMYFLKSLQDTTFDLPTGIVVIDDPVSSLDANSLYSAFGFLKERTRDAGQLFVLTHNFTFFRQVKNWFNKLPGQNKKDTNLHLARFYMLTSRFLNGERCADVGPLDPLLHRFESEYQYLFKRIHLEAHALHVVSLEEHYSMPNVARRILESFLSFRLPSNSGELHQQLEQVNFDVAKKTRILRFLHTHSHYGQISEPEHDLSVLSETRAILRDVLDLMKVTDPGHFEGMELLVATERPD